MDSLSKQPDWQIGVERDNEDRVLVKKKWLEVGVVQVIEVVIKGVDLLEEIRKLDAKDNEVIKAIEKIKQAEMKMLRNEE